LESETLRVEVWWGRVTKLTDKRTGEEWNAHPKTPFGHLRVYEVDTTGPLHVGAILGEQDVEWQSWEVSPEATETAPVCRSVRLQGQVGRHAVIQEIRLYAHEARIEFHVQIDWKGMDGFLASHLPLPRGGQLHGDMPFCVEAKDLAREPYGAEAGIERQREGMFIAQSFVDWSDGARGLAYLSHDGDRYYICSPSDDEPTLKHILINSFRRPPDWEKDINVQIEGVGQHSFTYSLIPHAADWEEARLWRESQNRRFAPIVVLPQGAQGDGKATDSYMSLTPDHVVMTACYCEGERLLFRLHETAGQQADVRLTVPFDIGSVEAVDLLGNPLPGVSVEGKENAACVTLKPWQIVTLAFTRGD
jgi:alpha-mannosidase